MKHAVLIALVLAATAAPALAEGDPIAGKTVFKKCMPCHALDEKNKVGPSLANIIGRPVASVEGYKYSKAMTTFAEGGRQWNEALLAEYLISPKALVKGTSMTFAGLKKLEDIANLTAYLKKPGEAP